MGVATEAATVAVAAPQSKMMAADFVMGGAAAVVAKSGAAPVERVKLLLQNQGEMMRRGYLTRPYMGIRDCFARVLKEEGALALWRGNQANVIRYLPTQAFNFAFKGYFRSVFGCSKEKDGYMKWLAGNVVSGSAAGATTSMLLYHLDYARTRLATDAIESTANNQRQFRGLLDVYRKTLASDGIVGLYRGFSVSIMGITLYRGLYFGIYDTMKPVVLVGPLEGNFFASFILGWSVTTFSGICAYPFDTLRRRMMITSGQPGKYKNAYQALKIIVSREGFFALFRGAAANMLSGMAGAGVLAGYDQLHRIANRHGYGLEHKLRGQFIIAATLVLKQSSHSFTIASTYGPPRHSLRAAFFVELNNFITNCSAPLILGGDFNITLDPHERLNCSGHTGDSLKFSRILNNSSLLDLPIAGLQYTWSNGQISPRFAKLDRVLISLAASQLISTSTVKGDKKLSDHNYLLFTSHLQALQRDKPFRMELSWFHSLSFRDIIAKSWEYDQPGSQPLDHWLAHWRVLRKVIRQWSSLQSKYLKRQRRSLEDRVASLSYLADSGGLNDFEMANFRECKISLDSFYYKRLLGHSSPISLGVEWGSIRLARIPDHQGLDAPFSMDEIFQSIKDMGSFKSPRPNGLPNEFFISFWDHIKEDLLAILQDLYLNPNLLLKVGADSNIYLWREPWCGSQRLAEKFPHLFRFVINKHIIIRDARLFDERGNFSGWNISFSTFMDSNTILALTEMLDKIQLLDGKDRICWRWSNDKLFSTMSLYRILTFQGVEDSSHCWVWQPSLPPKVLYLRMDMDSTTPTD
ncbi:hypothetical protein Cni_G04202 [Canna indica]|uniref:Endonuclease/exonuclease/phosphatase domain-containing protein n=1 Tax=Canna indica TaxID=4628 RepID=A0AAQ3JWE9_9LILI|nr:hypothetical protein Cni_G04202 [Canna indica]